MKVLEKGTSFDEAIVSCDCNNKGTTKCKGCEDSNVAVQDVKDAYSDK